MPTKTLDNQLKTVKNAIKNPLSALYLTRQLSYNQKEQVKNRVDGLMAELHEYCRYGSRYIFRDNTLPTVMPVKLNFKGRLRFLLDVIGENEIQKRFERTIKAGINAPNSILDTFPIFKSGDVMEFRDYKSSEWVEVEAIRPYHVRHHQSILKVYMKNIVEQPTSKYWGTLFQNTLIKGNIVEIHPEYFIRYLNRNKNTAYNKDDDFIVNSVLDELNEYVSESERYLFADYSLSTDRYINIKPRLQVLLDIIGKDKLHKKLSKYVHIIENLSDEELNKYSAFKSDDIIKYYDEKNELSKFVIGSGYPKGLFIHKINDSLDYMIVPQSELLRVNPEYFHRYLTAQTKDIKYRKKMKKLGVEC